MRLELAINDGDVRPIRLSSSRGSTTILLDGRQYRAALKPAGDGYEVAVEGQVAPIWFYVHHDTIYVQAFGRSWAIDVLDPAERARQLAEMDDIIRAPMPGSVVEIAVEPGEEVAEGAQLIVIESMKMQSTLSAPRDGVIERVHLEPGDTFDRGAALVSLVQLASGEG